MSVVAGTKISLVLEKGKTIYHAGPLSIYMGKAPKKAADWDGSGARWFKVTHISSTMSIGFHVSDHLVGLDRRMGTQLQSIQLDEYCWPE